MMSDFHSNILHDSLQPDMHNPSIGNGRLEAVSISNYEQPSNKGSQSLNINMIGANTQDLWLAQSPDNTKPVFRKTPLPCRRLIRNSKDSSLTLLPIYQRNKNLTVCDSIDSFEGRIVSTKLTTTDNERNNILATESLILVAVMTNTWTREQPQMTVNFIQIVLFSKNTRLYQKQERSQVAQQTPAMIMKMPLAYMKYIRYHMIFVVHSHIL